MTEEPFFVQVHLISERTASGRFFRKCTSIGTCRPSRPKLAQPAGVGQRQRHQVLRFELSQAALEAFRLAELLARVGAAVVKVAASADCASVSRVVIFSDAWLRAGKLN